ncbi:Pkr1-domain-containing protein [Lizonia empirigonia]|nr:Pkr1-domain-containing protein [Lizonia empirigonia]
MAGKFFEDLWESIFTPGPTPTLLIATNASFAALQLLFFALFIGTYSVHFVILSFLTGGLWYGINWFAKEIRIAQKAEEEAKRIRAERRGSQKDTPGDGDQADIDTGDDTEVDAKEEVQKQSEGLAKREKKRAPRPETQSTVMVDRPSERENTPRAVAAGASGGGPIGASTTGASTRLAPLVDDALKQRKGGLGESTGDLSTDSEWDKLSEDSEER